MNYESYYNQCKYEKNVKNESELIKTAENCLKNIIGDEEKKLISKINNSIQRGEILNLNLSSILNDILVKNPYALARYKKDPTRQNISEVCQINYIYNYKKFDFKKHSDDLRFTKDGTKIVDKKIPGAVSKSFDYNFKLKNGEIALGMGKTTFNLGGHQDNVEEEIILFLERMNSYNRFNDTPKKFFVLVDGDYWTDSIINKLKRFETDEIKVFTSNNITDDWG